MRVCTSLENCTQVRERVRKPVLQLYLLQIKMVYSDYEFTSKSNPTQNLNMGTKGQWVNRLFVRKKGRTNETLRVGYEYRA